MSSNVYISNVDDYVAPSQACVNPIFSAPTADPPQQQANDPVQKETPATDNGGGGGGGVAVSNRRRRKRTTLLQTSTDRDAEGGTAAATAANKKNDPPTAATTKQSSTEPPALASPAEVVQASLADCLACSGCVTTTETVLLEEKHSLDVLRRELMPQKNGHPTENGNETTTIHVLTLSPAAWADLFRHLELPLSKDSDNSSSSSSLLRYQQQFTHVVHTLLNIHTVLDGNLPLQWSLREAADEFCHSYRHKRQQQQPVVNGASSSSSSAAPSYEECKRQLWPSRALSKGQVQFRSPKDGSLTTLTVPPRNQGHGNNTTINSTTSTPQPLLSGSCPAVVCLVEKTAHPAVPHLATTASPMSMAGAWWKQQQQQQQQRVKIHHIAVMPCHDKKLEASRSDFSNQATQQHDVDISITTRECMELLQQAMKNKSKVELSSLSDLIQQSPLAPVSLDPARFDAPKQKGMLLSTQTTSSSSRGTTRNGSTTGTTNPPPFVAGSGGYADYIFRYACQELFGVHVDEGEIPWEPGSWNNTASATNGSHSNNPPRSARMAAALQRRNKDFYQATLYKTQEHDNNNTETYVLHKEQNFSTTASYEPVLRFALAYGMQTLQRMLKPFSTNANSGSEASPLGFDYVEAMACPSGCPNGGGQIIANDKKETPTETRNRLSQTRRYFSRPASSSVTTTMKEPLPIPLEDRHTTYHVVPPMQLSMGAAAGVAVQDIQW
mmetsp:Transcript_26162/g.61540  ORF Transcript_26162/g.61540 Transcript_26162/m.61540 type:complete len:724 (-) Transcript_26162:954-3125(-)